MPQKSEIFLKKLRVKRSEDITLCLNERLPKQIRKERSVLDNNQSVLT